MCTTIRDKAFTPKSRDHNLSKPNIDLNTALYAILILRISLGALFLGHGLLKVFTFTLPGTAQFFNSVGLPGFLDTPIALADIIGGMLLIVGFYSRKPRKHSAFLRLMSIHWWMARKPN